MKRVGYIASNRIKGDRPGLISLIPEIACVPGVGDGYTKPAFSRLVMGGVGQNIPYWQIEFDPDTEEAAWWGFILPKNFEATKNIKVRIHWISDVNAGDVVWGVSVLGRVEGEVFDAALGTEVEADPDTCEDVVGEMTTTEIELTPAQHGLAAKDVVTLQLARKAADGNDDMADDADVVMVDLEFAVDPRVQY